MYRKTVFIVAILFYALSFDFYCVYADADRVGLNYIMKIGSEDDDAIYRAMYVATDEMENIYICDAIDFSIKKFDKNGKFLKKSGKKGEGPGEFLAPGALCYYGGNLYVGQQMSAGVQIFDSDLKYTKTLPCECPPYRIKFVDNNIFVSSSLFSTNPTSVSRLNKMRKLEGFALMNNAVLKNSEKNKFVSNFMEHIVSFDIDKFGNLYSAHQFKNRVAKYDKEGNLIKEISIQVPEKEVSNTDNENISKNLGLPQEKYFSDLSFGPNDLLYLLYGGKRTQLGQVVFILNKDLSVVSKIYLKDYSHFLHISKSGRLYSRADDGAAIDVYKIITK